MNRDQLSSYWIFQEKDTKLLETKGLNLIPRTPDLGKNYLLVCIWNSFYVMLILLVFQ